MTCVLRKKGELKMSVIFKIIPPIRVMQLLGLLVEIYNEIKTVLKPLLKVMWFIAFAADITANGCVTWRSWVIPKFVVGALLVYILLVIYAGAGCSQEEREEGK